ATRRHPQVYLGASPRATLNLFELARAAAAAEGRDYVIPDDVKRLAEPVLAHRIILQPEARWEDRDERAIIRDIVSRTPVPVPEPGTARRTTP
ncbi:MAG TPA: AAA family ATPase, partial [Bacillota bacterium]